MNHWSECLIDYVSLFQWGFCTSACAFIVLVICTYRIGHFCHSKQAKFHPWQWSVQTNPFKNIVIAWHWLKKIAFKRRCMSRHDSAVSARKISTTVDVYSSGKIIMQRTWQLVNILTNNDCITRNVRRPLAILGRTYRGQQSWVSLWNRIHYIYEAYSEGISWFSSLKKSSE